MNTENPLGDSLEGTKQEKNKQINIDGILKTSILSVLGKGDILDPRFYNTIKNDSTLKEIRESMRVPNDYSYDEKLFDEAIQKVTDSKILGKIEEMSIPLRTARKLAVSRIYGAFPHLVDVLPKNNFSEHIKNLDENELSDIYTSRANMKKFLREEFDYSSEVLQLKSYAFSDIFATSDLKDKNPGLYKQTELVAIEYEKYGTNPSKQYIRDIISFFGSAEKKKEICEYFDLNFSIREALNLGLISQDIPEEIAKKEFAHIWKDLDPKDREKLVRGMRLNDSFELSISDIKSETWSTHFHEKDIQNAFVDGIYRKIAAAEKLADRNIPNSLEDLRKALQGKNIENIENWDIGDVLVIQDVSGEHRYMQLQEADIGIDTVGHGLKLASLSGDRPGTLGKAKGVSDISYEDFYDYCLHGIKEAVVMSESELRSHTTKDKEVAIEGGIIGLHPDQKIWDMSDIEDLDTEGALVDAINRIDPDGSDINDGKIEKGIVFISKSGAENKGGSKDTVYTIEKIVPPTITIVGRNNGKGEDISFSYFIEAIEKQGFKRIAMLDPVKRDTDMLRELGKFGVDGSHTQISSDGDLVTDIVDHSDDSHGHGDAKKSKKAKYEFFKNEEGGHIRIGGIKDGLVYFGEYDSEKKLEDVQKYKKAKKISRNEEKGLYLWDTMDYGTFLEYLRRNKLKATTENLIDPEAKHEHVHEPHLESSFWSKLGKCYNANDIIKGITNLIHHGEHYFEKTSKLNASRFTLAMAKKLNLPADLIAQAQSEEVTNVKEIIEKLREKLGNLNGPHARRKALHIAHNEDARPEEVGAAMLHMVKNYGQLYAEDIAFAEGSHSFIDGFMNACGFKGAALQEMKKKSILKFKADLGTEGSITEEEIMWGFMKTMDGNYEEFPLAATVVKAMGGPGGWEKAWRTEGFDNAYEKGLRQGGDTVNAQGRVNKGLSSLVTHEYNSAIGFMEKAAGKTPDPEIQTIPVVWALAGYSQYMSTKASQKVKSYGDSMGHTFHAYSFLRNHDDNLVYRDTFRLALQDIAPEEVKNLDKYIQTLQRKNHLHEEHNDKYAKQMKAAIDGLADIWKNYQKKGLHDMLQGKNSWLMEKVNSGNKSAIAYLNQFDAIHKMNGNENPPPDNDWMVQYGYDTSPMVGKVESDGKTILSIARTLTKMPLSPQGFDVKDKDRQDRLWPSVVKKFEENKKMDNEELRKLQYCQFRMEILTWLRRAISTRGNPESTLQDLKKKTYYPDLLAMGIDPRVIVKDGETMKIIKTTEDDDYNVWLQGGRDAHHKKVESIQQIMRSTVTRTNKWRHTKAANDSYIEEGNIKGGPNETDFGDMAA